MARCHDDDDEDRDVILWDYFMAILLVCLLSYISYLNDTTGNFRLCLTKIDRFKYTWA